MSKKRNARNTKKARKQLKGKLAGEVKVVVSLPPQGKDGIYYAPGIPKQAARATIQKAKAERTEYPNSDAVIYISRSNPGETAIAWYNRKVLKLFGESALDLHQRSLDISCTSTLCSSPNIPGQGEYGLYYNPFMPEEHMAKGMPGFFEESELKPGKYGFLEAVDPVTTDHLATWADKDEVDSQCDDPMEYFLGEAYTHYLSQCKAEENNEV